MKIITNENGSKVAFLQGKDLIFLKKYKENLPVLLRNQIVKDGNQREFYRIIDPESVKFISNEGALLDYVQTILFSEDELAKKFDEMIVEKKNLFCQNAALENKLLTQKLNRQTIVDTLSLQQKLQQQYETLQIQTSDLGVLMDLKRGKFFPELPLISTGERFSFVDCEDGMHEITSSLNPNQLLCFRKDKQPFDPEKFNNSNFIKKAVPLAIIEKQSRGELNFEFDINQKYSFKNEYLIIEFLPKEYQQEPEKEGKVMELIRKFIKIS